MSGQRLHMRGWRQQTGRAPLRESMAAAILRWCGWTPQEALLDPVCGSGTFLIEAATLALGLPANANRGFAFERWPSLDQRLWAARRQAASQGAPLAEVMRIEGSDRSPRALEATEGNAQRAGVLEHLALHQRAAAEVTPPDGPGLLVCNPPYGARIGARANLKPLYRALGAMLRDRPQWRGALLTSRPDLRDAFASAAGRSPARTLDFQHGGLKVQVTLLERP
jgi:putative N6-adenine-specific DNA methylase